MMSGSEGGVVRSGYLKKLKTSRKKFFVLRAETADASARLEYYDSERKFNNGLPPKRSIPLKNCFNINKRLDTKHKHVIALYTKDDCFCVVLDNDDDLDSWLKALLKLQHGEEVVDGETPKPTFEHVWQVTVLNRGLGNAGLTGNYRLCLTDKTLSLIKRDCEKPTIELNLSNIRSCGNLRDFFFLEIGRSSTLGAGELWMQTEDNNIAQNVHSTVFHAMSTNSSSKDELGPKSRNRSSSATESSKPNMTRKIHIAPKCHIFLPPVSGVASFYQHLIQRGAKASERRHSISAGSLTHCGVISHQRTQSLPLANPAPLSDHSHSRKRPKCMSRERCDSMPSRARTTSEGNHRHLNPYRPASLYGRDISHSPPLGSPVSPPCSTDSAGSSYSLTDETDVCTEMEPSLGRYGHSLTPDEAIAEEDCPDSPPYNNYISMTLHSSDDGYVDMSPRGRHHNSPTASMSSVTSGTPSTDMRFAEYPLEKVTSYLADDDGRPARAYSVGSKPERYKKYTEMGGNSDNLRARALSVGSKKPPARVLPPHGYHHPGTKSSSAPILTNSRGQGSYNSIGPMDDLMEMDFSHNSGYMDMKPVNSGYVEMKPGRKPETSPYVDMSSGSSPAKPSYISPAATTTQTEVYMEMDPRKNHSEYLSMSFTKKLPSPGSPGTPEGYVEMSLGRGHNPSQLTEDYANMSLNNTKKRPNRKKDKNRSEPINIQGGPNPRSLLLARKHSTGTPPTMYLPLVEATPHDSKDSSSSSINTPSSSSTIFPISLNSPSKATPDYIPMDFDKSDYVNYDPKPGVGEFRPINESNDDEGRAYEVLRPSSSESCSTIGGSRPASVSSAHMHYASLDLDEGGNRSPRTVKGSGGEQGEVTLTYAAIDFVKSEGLKHNAVAATNAKVKH
ncbi:insulin receptor substrate 1 isoform X3 [Tribolium castaneum]|uniref:insulin receptor substrate 1 isoform X3 n=1 Tax=Tribolium castaneum TaxID=7070 RepID=UPI00046C2414|nr:PREDICTED: insulin receptor substrate 1 isoform X3 [Tribolium castaneum]|eukprot:XP_008196598.1 PREDICTED: insulin receptor substrate 1 isoform X3 [Tribolium castaneum]